MDVLGNGSTDNEAELLAEFVDLGVAGLVDELKLDAIRSADFEITDQFLYLVNRARVEITPPITP